MKLFVGGLHPNTDSDALERHFKHRRGFLGANVIFDRTTGESRRFGYVEFASVEDATDAMKELHGTRLDGFTIRIEVAQPKRGAGV